LGQERQEGFPLENEELAWREARNARRTRPAVDQREFAEILARRAGVKIDLVAVIALLVDPDFPGKDDIEAIGASPSRKTVSPVATVLVRPAAAIDRR
jgi:hypothetical protein